MSPRCPLFGGSNVSLSSSLPVYLPSSLLLLLFPVPCFAAVWITWTHWIEETLVPLPLHYLFFIPTVSPSLLLSSSYYSRIPLSLMNPPNSCACLHLTVCISLVYTCVSVCGCVAFFTINLVCMCVCIVMITQCNGLPMTSSREYVWLL